MKTNRLLDIKTMLFMMLCTIFALSSCSKDEDDSNAKEMWYASQTEINNIKLSQRAFVEIEKAIDNKELLEKTYVSNGNYLNRYAERSSFVYGDGGFATIGKVGRLKDTINGSLDAIRIIDENTLSFCHFELYVDEDVQNKNMEKIATLFRGHIFKSVSVYKTYESYYTYVKLEGRIILSDGTIYIDTSQGLIPDGSSDLMVKMNPNKIFVVSNDTVNNDKDDNEKDDGDNQENQGVDDESGKEDPENDEVSKKEEISYENGTENGHDYVDLGLSVKWATMNVGATTIEGYGEHFAWGETTPKVTDDWSTYKWAYGSENTLTKYCTRPKYGDIDNETSLEAADDAATVNWGGRWRMPTAEELRELKENCTFTWITRNGVNGYRLTSKITLQSIFLPAAGFYDYTLGSTGKYGGYWSSSCDTNYPCDAFCIYFYSTSVDCHAYNRCYGRSVRAVCP